MRYVTLVMGTLLVLSGCGGSGGGGGSADVGGDPVPVSVRYANGTSADVRMTGLSRSTGETNIPLLFYGPRMRAYQYGARAAMVGEMQNATWSTWNLIPGAGEFFLKDGGVADLETSFAEFLSAPDYVTDVGTFSFDFVLAKAEPAPVNTNNSVCGIGFAWYRQNTPIYPELNFGTCQHKNVVSSVDGEDMSQLRALFARRDWFPNTLQIYFAATSAGLTCYQTSAPISKFQEEILTSLFNLEYDTFRDGAIFYDPACTTGRSKVELPTTIIPMTGDLAVAKITQDAIAQPPIVTDGGETIPQPDKIVIGSNLEAEIAFNLVPSMVVNYTEFNIDSDTSDIVLNPGVNGAPWGMDLNFRAAAP